jgi:hypothetical protein
MHVCMFAGRLHIHRGREAQRVRRDLLATQAVAGPTSLYVLPHPHGAIVGCGEVPLFPCSFCPPAGWSSVGPY